MTRWLTESSLRLSRLVVVAAVGFLVLGMVQLRDAPVDVYPEFSPPTVQIQTDALGLSATEVEQLITVPLEQDLLNGIPWLDKLRSQSMPGLSSIDLIFDQGTDIMQARQMVQERLSQAHALPNVGTPPFMIQPLSSTSRVMMIGLSAKDLSLVDMSILARWKIRPRLLGLPGVANVAIWGQRDRQLQVQVDPERLHKYGVTLSRVIDSTGNALWVSPLTFVEASTPGTGGFIDTPNQRFSVQHVLPITTADSLASVTLEDTSGRTLRLGDVAKVTEDHQPLIGDAVVDNGPNLVLVVQKFPEANTREVTKAVENALSAMAPGLSGITIDTNLYRPASFIDAGLRNVGLAGLVGIVLVVLLLGLLMSWRAALIGALTVPLSLVAAAYVLYRAGSTLNSMVAVGLVMAVGVVVDDAIVAADAIRRRLRQRRGDADAASGAAAIGEAMADVRGALVYGTLVPLLATVPFVLLPGVTGAFTRPLVASYALAVLASLVVAVTVTPALAAMTLPRSAAAPGRTRAAARWAQRAFDRRGSRLVTSARSAYATVGALVLVGALAVAGQVGGLSSLAQPQDRDLLVHWDTVAGTSLPEMDWIATTTARELRAIPGFRDVGAHVGRAVTSDQVVDVNSSELWVSLASTADYDATTAAIRRVIDGYPGMTHQLVSYPQDQVRAAETGSTDPLVVRLYGQDLQVLAQKGAEVRRLLQGVPGVVAPTVHLPVVEPTAEVHVDLQAAEKHGIKPGDVRRAAATLLSGIAVGSLYEEQKVFDVVVWGSPAIRHSPSSLENLMIETPSGRQIRLGDVASVSIRPNPVAIRHDDVSRSLDVTAQVGGRDIGSVVRDVQARIGSVKMPLEYHAEVVSDELQQQSENRRTLAYALACTLLAFLLLQAAVGSWRLATMLLLTLPLAGVGGALVALTIGGISSVSVAAGIFAVLAVTARSCVLLVRRFQRASEEDGTTAGRELVVQETRRSLPTVLVTTLGTAAAVLPLALLGGRAGTELLSPLAVVILGGLVTSTLVTLLVVPALYVRLASEARRPAGEPTTNPPAA